MINWYIGGYISVAQHECNMWYVCMNFVSTCVYYRMIVLCMLNANICITSIIQIIVLWLKGSQLQPQDDGYDRYMPD